MTGNDQHAEQPVNFAWPSPRDAMGTQSGTAHLAVSDLGTWRGHHAVAVEMGTPAKVDAVPEYRQGRVKTVEMPPDRRPYQHPAGGDAKSFLRMIALPLIDLVDIEIELPTASPGDADPDLADRLAAVPPPRQQQLRTGQIDTLIRRHVRQQLVERVRCRHCVVVQQPQPVRVFRRYGAEADGVGV